MSEPLVVIDADVLGRQRTGDETYVAGLLSGIAGASGLRLAAVTRNPHLVPAGIGWRFACPDCFAAYVPRSRTFSTRYLSRARARPS